MNTVPTGAVSRPALPRGAAAGLAALLTLLLAAISPLFSTAHAAENPGITVTNMSLTRVDGSNADQEGNLNYYDNARLSFDWDASGTTLKSGDSFTINLGTYFENLQVPSSLPMTVDHNGADTQVGTCELTAKEITCTFSDKVAELQQAGFHNFKGNGSALLAITQTTTSTARRCWPSPRPPPRRPPTSPPTAPPRWTCPVRVAASGALRTPRGSSTSGPPASTTTTPS